jgi:hypothetical protein
VVTDEDADDVAAEEDEDGEVTEDVGAAEDSVAAEATDGRTAPPARPLSE